MSEATSQAERHALLDRLFSAFNSHDADGIMGCFTPGVVFDTAAGPEAHGRRLIGQDAVRAAFVAVWTEMPDVSWAVARHTLSGERATSEWLFSGTRANGGRIAVEGVDLFVFDGPLIARKSAFRKDRPVQAA